MKKVDKEESNNFYKSALERRNLNFCKFQI